MVHEIIKKPEEIQPHLKQHARNKKHERHFKKFKNQDIPTPSVRPHRRTLEQPPKQTQIHTTTERERNPSPSIFACLHRAGDKPQQPSSAT